MKSAAILLAGIVALGLLAVLCLPRHLPPSTASAPLTPANFHARVEYGTLILRGSLPSETSKAAILQRAQELYGATPGSVVDELVVDPRAGPVAWVDSVSKVLPVLGHITERGSIIIDGRSIVLSGQVAGNRAKAVVLQDIVPLTQTGLELEDRIQTGPFPKASSLAAAPSPKAPSKVNPSLAAVPSTKAPSLPVAASPAARALAEAPPSSLQKKINEILAHASIEFESKSSTITPSSLAILDQLIVQLRQFPPIPIEIGGHTDKYGEPEYNLELSQHRADTVRRYFAKQGLPKQFTAIGYGDSRPLSVRGNRAALQRNRRIELRVKGQTDL